MSSTPTTPTTSPSRPTSPPPSPSSQEPSPYTAETLSPRAKVDLATLVHFLLLSHPLLNLSPHTLLHNRPETSLLTQTGAPFHALTTLLSPYQTNLISHLSTLSPRKALSHLRILLDENLHQIPHLRLHLLSAQSRVLPAARPQPAVRDGAMTTYIWLRGPAGCASDRVLACAKPEHRDAKPSMAVLRTTEINAVIDALEEPPRRRTDLLAATWLSERVVKAERRAKRVEAAERERVRVEEEKERERKIRLQRISRKTGLVRGEVVDVVGCGRGRRKRTEVCYEEVEEDVVEDGWDCVAEEEFVVDGSDGEADVSEEESDGGVEEEEGEDELADEEDVSRRLGRLRSQRPVAAGRVRVMSGGRVTRARAKEEEELGYVGRPVRKCRRLTRGSCV